MLTVIRSPAARVPLDSAAWPADAGELAAVLSEQPERCHWIVPGATPRARRLALGPDPAILPHPHTLERFVRLLATRVGARVVLRPIERIVRLGQTWHEITGNTASPGLLGQLDRFVRDWQLAALPVPARPGDHFENLLQRYLRDLERDSLHDEPEQLAALVRELGIEATPLPSSLAAARLVLFDGFLRLAPLYLRLITELSRRIDVLVWLPRVEAELADEMVVTLRRRRVPLRVIDVEPPAVTSLAAVGRRLFTDALEPAPAAGDLFYREADTPRGEVEQAARGIKADLRDGFFSLPDVAVIVPNEAYAGLVAEVLPRHGLAVDTSALPTRVRQTRPTRLLESAWQVLRGSWRYEGLRDFLVQPMVRWRLEAPRYLDDLFEHRPRVRQQRTSATWLDAWQRHVRQAVERLAATERGEREIPARDAVDRERKLAQQRERTAGLARLLESIRRVLEPIVAMEAAREGGASRPGALPELAQACLALFEAVALPEWLAHPETEARDALGFDQLAAGLRFLAEMPRHHRSFASLWQPDPLDTLRDVLASLTFFAPSGPGVRVQMLDESASIAARRVHVLGLQEGVQPAPSQDEVLVAARARQPILRGQMQQQEAVTRARFRALFEAPTACLVLSRPVSSAEERARASPFLKAVEAYVPLQPLEVPMTATCVREASRLLGRAYASREAGHETLAELWPDAAENARLQDLVARLQTWSRRDGWPRRNRIDAPVLLHHRFPDDLAFSASDLETYAACPFRYFSQRVLKVEGRDVDLSRAHYGSLVHNVFQIFYDELRASGAWDSGEPLPPITPAHTTRVLELFEREWRRLGDGLIPPDLRTMFTVDQGVLQLFFDVMEKLEGQHGNLRNEFAIEGVPLGQDDRGRTVRVSGRIDRIDRHRETEQTIILDYKTGRAARPAERKAKTEDGRLLQLPLYAAALSIDQGMAVVGGAYVHLHEREVNVDRAIEAVGDVTWDTARPADVPFDPEAARRKAIELAGRIRDGDFSLTPHAHGQPHSECTSFCPLRHACRSPEGYKTISM